MDTWELLEDTLLMGTPRDAAEFFKSHQKDLNAGRALAIACRFCGLEYVKALAESGAEFNNSEPYYWRDSEPYYWLAVLEFNEKQHRAYCANAGDDCFETQIKRTRVSDNSVETFHLLPTEERAEIVKYLCENSGRVHFEPGELLFFSITSSNKIITAALRDMGVTFTEEWIFALTESPSYYRWFQFSEMLGTLDNDVLISVIRDVMKEVGGKRIRIWSKYRYLGFSLCSRKDQFFDPKIFRVFLESFKLSRIDKDNLLKEVIDQSSMECLEICAERGWLNQPCKRDEIIAYASGIKYTECVMWLLDFQNRNFDIAAERAKAEKKALHELNAPDSIAAHRNIWNWKKQKDGTLVITGYNGTNTIVKVPSRIGRRAVTAISRGIFDYDDRRKNSYFLEISKVVLPDGIRCIGENAFSWRSCIEEQVIPDSVVEIGEGAFRGCRKLSKINIPSVVKEIGDDVFSRCGALRSVKLPAGIRRIGKCAFERCRSLEELVVPNGTVEIGEKAFSKCRALETVVIPASVTEIGEDIFLDTKKVTAVVEPNSFAEEYCKQNNIPFRHGTPGTH